MRKKKGSMASASTSSSSKSPKGAPSTPKSPAKSNTSIQASNTPKMSMRSITPSPIMINKHAVSSASPTQNGSTKDASLVPNGKIGDDKSEKMSSSLVQPSPRTPRHETPGPSGLSPRQAFMNDNSVRPMSSASSVTSVLVSPEAKGKVTVGEIVQQIEVKSSALMKKEDFTKADVWPDLSFLAQQSRYNSDMHVKRKLYMRMVDNGLLTIFLKVFRSIHSIDFLQILHTSHDENSENTPDAISVCNDTGKDKDSISYIEDKEDDDRSIGVPEDGRDKKSRIAVDRYRNMPDFMKNFRAAITLLWNVSEKSPALCEDCIKKGMIQLLLTDLTDQRLGVNELKDPNKLHIVKGYLGILSNLVRFHSDARDIFRDSGAVKILQHYLKSSLLVIKSKTVMLLSYIISESENDIINASDKHIAFFAKVLQTAMESENHYAKKYGYWAVEVVAGLNRLGAFESNKERIVQKGVVPLYTRLLSGNASEEEQILACQGLWVFAFSTTNRHAIILERGCVEALEHLEHNGSREETRRTAKGALWVIQQRTSTWGKNSAEVKENGRDPKDHGSDLLKNAGRENAVDHGKDPVSQVNKELREPPGSPIPGGSRASNGDVGASYMPHVMISYQWSTRLVMSKVRDRLRTAGYKVWMDTDNIALPSLEAMSLAVERAAVVLICLSQKYKDSPICRTEAEYASRLRKEVIPLKLQPRYHPDGWLGRQVGSKLAFDFTSEDNIDNMMPNLIRELNAKGRVRGPASDCSSVEAMRYLSSPSMTSLNSTVVPMEIYNQKGMRLVAAPSLSSINTAIHVDATMRISSWNVEDVSKWLNENDLGSLQEKFGHVNGELLIEIRKMQTRAPETFYNTIKNELKLDFVSTLKFTRALDKLT